MPCSIRAQARSLTMGRHAAPLAQRQRDVALEPAVASDRALDKLLLAFEPRCRVPSAGATRFAVLGPHPRAAIRRTFVVVGCSFCCRLEAVQPSMISPDDKRLGARPARLLAAGLDRVDDEEASRPSTGSVAPRDFGVQVWRIAAPSPFYLPLAQLSGCPNFSRVRFASRQAARSASTKKKTLFAEASAS